GLGASASELISLGQEIGDRTRFRIGGACALEVSNGSIRFLGLEPELSTIAIGVCEIGIERYGRIGRLFRLVERRSPRRNAFLDQGFGNEVMSKRVIAFAVGRRLEGLDGPIQFPSFELREPEGEVSARIRGR